MYLVKFTNSHWKTEALEGRSIRIGSVLYYRTIGDPAFRDEDEGEGAVVYKSKEPLDAETHNRLFQYDGVQLAGGWKINTGGVPLISSKSTFNPFIFSCSLVRRKGDIPKVAKIFKKDAWYFIGDAWKFANSVSEELRNYLINVSNDIEMSKEVKGKLERLELLPVLGKIKYSNESKERVVDDELAKSFDPNLIQLEPYFTKPKSYADEQEFRFIWIPNLGSIKDDEFDLSSTNIPTIDLALPDIGLTKKSRSVKEILSKSGKKIA